MTLLLFKLLATVKFYCISNYANIMSYCCIPKIHWSYCDGNEKPSAVYFRSVRAKDGNRIVHFQILLRLTLLKYLQIYPFSMSHSLKVARVIVTINLFYFF